MGRTPWNDKRRGLNRGAWSAQEDQILRDYIKTHGEGKWGKVQHQTGLKRCGKSCRLRWLNYLRPDIKRGNITDDEEDLIIRLHKLLGNRWCLIAGRLPGRTDNEIKNYWNTTLKKKLQANDDHSKELVIMNDNKLKKEQSEKPSPSLDDLPRLKNMETLESDSTDELLQMNGENDTHRNSIMDLNGPKFMTSAKAEFFHNDFSKVCEFNSMVKSIDDGGDHCNQNKNGSLPSSSDDAPLFSDELLEYWASDDWFQSHLGVDFFKPN